MRSSLLARVEDVLNQIMGKNVSVRLQPCGFLQSTNSTILKDKGTIQAVLTTQLTTQLLTADGYPGEFKTSQRSVLVPSLGLYLFFLSLFVFSCTYDWKLVGNTWQPAKCYRIVLYGDHRGRRRAAIVRAPTQTKSHMACFVTSVSLHPRVLVLLPLVD
jgi:hypothetical protein